MQILLPIYLHSSGDDDNKPSIMEQNAQLVARISVRLNDTLKKYADALTEQFGVPVTVASAARLLLTEGLERHGFPVPPPDPTAPKPRRGRPPKKRAPKKTPMRRKTSRRGET